MKKYLMLALSFVFSFSLLVNAQNQGVRTQGRNQLTVKERVERMATQLDLNQEQKVQVEALLERQDQERKELREQALADRQAGVTQNREGMQVKYAEKRKAENAELEQIIGKEKMKKYLKIQEEMRQQVRQQSQRNRGDN